MSRWIVIHNHDHGDSSYVVEYDSEPTTNQLVRCLGLHFEPSLGEDLVVTLLEDNDVQVLDWKDSDGEEFDEFADEAKNDEDNEDDEDEISDGD